MRALVAVMLLLAGAGAVARADEHAMLPAPVDLRADAAQSAKTGKPIVILFSLPDCPYCKVVRENYLAPLLRADEPARQPIIREVSVSSDQRFIGFQRESLSHSELARSYGVQFAPTVILLDKNGKLLAEPIIGGDTAGFYGGYLDNAFAEAGRKLRMSAPNPEKGKSK